jgi:tRNA 2-selenouridine synthase
MSRIIGIDSFSELKHNFPLIDVRSPSEYSQGHIPGAINIALFSDQERAQIGILFKNSGQKDAILRGLEITGFKIRSLAEAGINASKKGQVILYCWRGGMRSASMAWLFETCGIDCYVLSGGYKTYRNYIHNYFSQPFRFFVLGGMTGTGKTEILKEISRNNLPAIDLEGLANHKGSAFGSLGEAAQKSNEQFENDLFTALESYDITKAIFIEDESLNIGQNIIPPEFYSSMSGSPLILLEMNQEFRLERILKEYGKYSISELRSCIEKLTRRMGGQNTIDAIKCLENADLRGSAQILLDYYDKTYKHSISRRRERKIIRIKLEQIDPKANAGTVVEFLKNSGIIN